MKKFGLIGYPLSHSFSKPFFTKKFKDKGIGDEYCYENFPLEKIEDFPELLKSEPDLVGLNVTIPYKEAVLPYLDSIDEAAASMKAVNVIKIDKKGKLKGFNTDFLGFNNTLQPFLLDNGGPSKKALILGTGGASKAIAYALSSENVSFKFVSRVAKEQNISYEMLSDELMAEIDLIVNTTPLGMYPKIAGFPNIPYHCLGKQHRLFDLVYNPPVTAFLQKGKDNGAAIFNGLYMLHEQAEESWNIWNK